MAGRSCLRKLLVERLGARTLLASDIQVSLFDSELQVVGTEQADQVSVIQQDDSDELLLQVRSSATSDGIASQPWVTHRWQSSAVRSVKISVAGGDDNVRYEMSSQLDRFDKQFTIELGEGDDVGSVVVGAVRANVAFNIHGDVGRDKLSYRAGGDLDLQSEVSVFLDGGSDDDSLFVDMEGKFSGIVSVVEQGGLGSDRIGLSLLRDPENPCARYLLSGGEDDDRFNVDFGGSDGAAGDLSHKQIIVDGGAGQNQLVGPDDLQSSQLQASRINDAWQAAIDSVVQPYRDALPELNLVVGIRTTAGSRKILSYGDLLPSVQKQVDPQTEFEIGSITKTFTATALAELVQRGDVRLTDPVREYLPEGSIVPKRGSHEITLGELATHRSGLPRDTPSLERLWTAVLEETENGIVDEEHRQELLQAEARRDWNQLQQDVLEIQLPDEAEPAPNYSNLGFGLLGFALSHHLGLTYDEMIRELVLQPLGLRDIFQSVSEDRRTQLPQGYFDHELPVPPMDFDSLAGAGALRASGIDLLRYMESQFDASHSSLQNAITLAQTIRGPAPADIGDENLHMGLGWLVGDDPAGRIVSHNGATFGFQSSLFVNTTTGAGYVILVNSRDDRASHLLTTLSELLSSELLIKGHELPVDNV